MKKKVTTSNSPGLLSAPSFQYNPADYGVADQLTVDAAPNSFMSYNA